MRYRVAAFGADAETMRTAFETPDAWTMTLERSAAVIGR